MNRHPLLSIMVAWFLLASQLVVGQTVAPQTSLAGQKIERFEVVGNTSVASDTIRIYLGVVPGDPYDPALIQKNFANLWQTGLFDDIRVEADKGDTGVVVRAVVVERPRIGAVEYRGNKNLQTSKIVEALEKDKIDVHVGNTMEQTLIRRAAESIKKAYSEAGYEGVTVTPTMEAMNQPEERRVVFTINEGIKARVALVDFTGNAHFSDRSLRGAMKDVKKHTLYTWVRKKDIYTPSKLDDDLEKVRNFYLDRGYQNVSFGDPVITTVGSKKKPRVKIVIPVVEGEIYKFGEVTVTGNTVFTSEQIIGNWPLKKGETMHRKAVQNRIDAFQELYQRRGYIYSYVNPVYEQKPGNVVDVHLNVYEGEQFKLGRLEFSGNTTTKDKVLRREMYIQEGDIMDMETFKTSMFKIGQLGYFKITENPDFKVNQQSKTVDINIKGQEQGRNDVQFGGGYSESYGFFGQFQFSTRNFLGEGESIGASFQRGRQQNFFSVSYSNPWFLDRPHLFGVSLYNRNTVQPASVGFESTGKGGSVQYGYRVSRFQTMSFMYGAERRQDHSEFTPLPDDEGNVPLPLISDTTFTTSGVVPTWRYDSRDNPFDTTHGLRETVSLAYEGGPFGGTINIFKPELNYTIYHRVSRLTTVSFNAEAGQIFPQSQNCADLFADLEQFNNELCVPRSERYYVGGESSVRGFQSYSLGPKETVGVSSVNVGGYKKLILNGEYIFRVNDPLRFVLFADAGQAYGPKEDWDLSMLRYSAGAELRIFLPVFQFPLRFIYAFNPDPHPGDDFTGFQFSIGNTF